MTNTRPGWAVVSANDAFKSNYERTLRWSALVALVVGALLVWFSPRYEPTPYRLRTSGFEWVDVPDDFEVPDEPEVLAPPVLPKEVVAVDDEDPDAVDPPEFLLIDDPLPPLAPVAPDDTGFVASSARPVLRIQPKPHYPEVARLAQVEGTVVVKVLVNAEGRVEEVAIVSGAHPLLNKAALDAARRCAFEPGRQRGVPVRAWVAVPYNFRLR
ncbi:energy transducer TonB [bacterium]|nr:energy transducer TonB [bacterium]